MKNNCIFAITVVLYIITLSGCASTDNSITTNTTETATVRHNTSTPDNTDVAGNSVSKSTLLSASQTAQSNINFTPASLSAEQNQADDYRIGPQDLLEIQVFGIDELSRTVRVNTRGNISLPLIGLVQAAGLTSQGLETHIATLLAEEYLQNPQVSVFIEEYASQRVTVGGAVKKPGIYPLKGQTTLLQAIAAAEGLEKLANPEDVKLLRNGPAGEKLTQRYNLNDISEGYSVDPIVQGNDIVVVGENKTKAFMKDVTDTLRGFVTPFVIY